MKSVSKVDGRCREAAEHRQAILRAACDLLFERGYKRMTIDDVAQEANLGKGTIYLYFDSKEELALACIERFVEKLHENMRQVARSKEPPVDKLRTLLTIRISYRVEKSRKINGGSLDEILEGIRQKLREKKEKIHAYEQEIIAEVLVEGRTLGIFDFDDPRSTADALVTATNALLPYSLSRDEIGRGGEIERRTENLVALLIRSVQPKSGLDA